MATQFRKLPDGSLEIRNTDGSLSGLIVRPDEPSFTKRLNMIIAELGELLQPLRNATFAHNAQPFEVTWNGLEAVLRELEPTLRNLDDAVDEARVLSQRQEGATR